MWEVWENKCNVEECKEEKEQVPALSGKSLEMENANNIISRKGTNGTGTEDLWLSAEVMNCTVEIKGTLERMKMVLDAARRFLNVVNIS